MAASKGPAPSEKLADGEDPSTTSLEEVKSWVHVYDELVDLETTVIRSVKDRMKSMSATARRITEQTNLPDMEEDAERFRGRLAFWQGRLAQLERSHRA